MNKKKLIVLLAVVIPLITGISIFAWFVSNIRIYGTFEISIIQADTGTISPAFVKAHTPTGKEIIIPINNSKAVLSGFFKDAYIILPCNGFIESLTISNNWKQHTYTLNIPCAGDKKNFSIPDELVIGRSFGDRTLAFAGWLLSVKAGHEIVFILLIIFVLTLSFFIFRQTRRAAKTETKRFSKRLLKQLLVVLAGFIFWSVILFILIEAGLRIFGSFYADPQIRTSGGRSDTTLTVLCLGDSFTFGIGAQTDKSYPSQLADLIRSRENIPVRVINAGVCAGNTTQMLEEIQKLLDTYHPDVVTMLFGMANSWNYYGFSNTDNFLYRIRTYKLIIRILQNLKNKRSGFEMFERVNDFSDQLLENVRRTILERKGAFDIAYSAGRFLLSKKKWREALYQFSAASSRRPLNDSTRHALWVCTEKLDYDFYYSKGQTDLIQNTLVRETISLLDSMISRFPAATDLKIIRYRYYAVKGDTVSAAKYLQPLCSAYPDETILYFDLDKILTGPGLKNYFESPRTQNNRSVGFTVSRGYYFLRNGKPNPALECFNEALEMNPRERYANTGKFIIELQKKGVHSVRGTAKDFLRVVLISLFQFIYKNMQIPENNDSKADTYFNYFKLKIKQDIDRKKSPDSVFLFYCDHLVKQLTEVLHEDFFLYHVKKRSMNLREQDVFMWIEKDINTIIDICSRQGYPVICMNYPLIPPPNSEEISFWAAKVGDIWERAASKRSLPFINQDSLFTAKNPNKNDLFEPAFTGTEHCNEKGYGLMALNIYQCMKNMNCFFKQIKAVSKNSDENH